MTINRLQLKSWKIQDFFIFRRNPFAYSASIEWNWLCYLMKKYAFLVILFIVSLTSCSIESDDSVTLYLEVLPIENVEVPEQFVYGQTYEIRMTYSKPNSCYEFNDFIYEINEQERTVALVNTVYVSENAACVPEPEQETVQFNFKVTGTEAYLFKFYQGEDEEGENLYYTVEVPVVLDRKGVAEAKD